MKKVLILLMSAVLVTASACGNPSPGGSSAAPASSFAHSRDFAPDEAEASSSAPSFSAEPSSGTVSSEDEEGVVQVPAEEDASGEEKAYIEKLNTLFPEIAEKLPLLAELSAGEESSGALLDDLRKPFTELAGLEAPEKYTDAQAKLAESAGAMLELTDSIVEISAMDPESVTDEVRAEMMAKLAGLGATVTDAFEQALALAGVAGEADGAASGSGEEDTQNSDEQTGETEGKNAQ